MCADIKWKSLFHSTGRKILLEYDLLVVFDISLIWLHIIMLQKVWYIS